MKSEGFFYAARGEEEGGRRGEGAGDGGRRGGGRLGPGAFEAPANSLNDMRREGRRRQAGGRGLAFFVTGGAT